MQKYAYIIYMHFSYVVFLRRDFFEKWVFFLSFHFSDLGKRKSENLDDFQIGTSSIFERFHSGFM